MPTCHLLAERFYHKLKMWRWKKMPNFLCKKVVVTNLFSEYFMENNFLLHFTPPGAGWEEAPASQRIWPVSLSFWVSVRWEEISIFPPEEDKCADKRDNLFYLMFIARVLQEIDLSPTANTAREKLKHWWSFLNISCRKAPSRLSHSRNCI